MSSTAKKIQVIQSLDGKPEYVLVPYSVYRSLKSKIDDALAKQPADEDFRPFGLDEYVDNPVALARIKARLSQQELADRMGVTQAYISKIERQEKVTAKVMDKVTAALKRKS